jgi:hypothetical protein
MNNPAPTSAERTEQEARAAFEHYVTTKAGWPNSAMVRHLGRYKDHVLQSTWIGFAAGWQARAAMQTAEPVGWKLVPIDAPTAMILAIEAEIDSQLQASGLSPRQMQRQDGGCVYDAMLAAAPDRAPSIAPAMACTTCGVDRFKSACPEPSKCGLVADALSKAAHLYPLLDDATPAPSIDSAAGWISVEDRLPEDAAFVAIFDPENTDMPVRTAQWLAGSCTFESEYGWLAKDEITHWQPLPAPPAIAALQPEGK